MTARAIVILTGAGISQESGLDTFRDANGLWSKVRIEDVATQEAFRRDPERVHAFYNARRKAMAAAALHPNSAHCALAELERRWRGEFLLVTQNIDALHERAGSARFLHMHGELLKARCGACDGVHAHEGDLTLSTPCPTCRRLGAMRPHVVWFGEMPLFMEEIEAALATCDLFLSIGTSGQVYPAASFVREASGRGAHTVELNLEPSEGASRFAEAHYGKASQVVPAYVERLLAEG
ncbi:MAG TPA: Sir2 family NAD+-dependent deacetylase [Stellaceae bacterium]|nr:Sir2 family NAD+-dependent deacetylase [Stellaceae bacterium]